MKLVSFYGNLSLRNKILLWLLIVTFITVVPVGIFSFVTSSRIAMRDEVEKKRILLDVIRENVYEKLHDSERVAIAISHDPEILQALEDESGAGRKRVGYLITKTLYTVDTEVDLRCIAVFSRRGNVYANVNDAGLTDELATQNEGLREPLYASTGGIWGTPVVQPGRPVVLPYFRRIKDYGGTAEEAGAVKGSVAIGLNQEEVRQCYEKYDQPDEYIVVLSESGLTLSSDNPEWIGLRLEEYFTYGRSEKAAEGSRWGAVGDRSCLAVEATDERTGLTFLSITPTEIMMAAPNSIIVITVLVMGLAILLAILAALLVSSTIARPLTKLVEAMDRVDEVGTAHSFVPRYRDEVGRLAGSFISMTDRLKNSMDRAIEEENRRRLAEYNALKWQINPHFMYNTLSSIAWLAKKGYTDEIMEMTQSLSTLLRIGISKDRDLITIREEVEHVRCYLDIQQIRYQEQFKYLLDIDPDILGLYTVKIILQPLVENAIYHGVRDMNRMGLIKITGRLVEDGVVLSVTDNGGNLSEETAERLNTLLLSPDSGSYPFGIGIKNVHDRIRYHCKNGYGLTFRVKGTLTEARIRLPRLIAPHAAGGDTSL